MTRPDASTITDHQLDQLYAELDSARAQLARLHEGEAPTDDDPHVTSPALFIRRWNRATAAERLRVAESLQGAAARGDRCFIGDHEQRITELQQRLVTAQGDLERHQTDLHFAEHTTIPAAQREAAEWRARAQAVTTTLGEALSTFVHKVHPGRPCLQSSMVGVATVEQWRGVLHAPAPPPSAQSTCCVCGTTLDTSTGRYENYRGQLFCPPCGDCDCNQVPCTRKGTRATDAQREPADWRTRAETAEAERDGAYRERAQLVAWLAATHPAVLAPAPDIDEPGWQIIYLHADGQQLSWHIHPRDADLFHHVEQVPASDPRAQWDGHTTAEKYDRIRRHIADTYAGRREQAPEPIPAQRVPRPMRPCCVCGTLLDPTTHGYETWLGELFCWPCVDCTCNQDRCVRTGINAASAPEGSQAQPVVDTCHTVTVDGDTVRVRGAGPLGPMGELALAEVIRAAKRRYAAEHPDAAAGEPA